MVWLPIGAVTGLLIGLGTLRWFWLGALLLAIPGLLIAALGAGTFSFP